MDAAFLDHIDRGAEFILECLLKSDKIQQGSSSPILMRTSISLPSLAVPRATDPKIRISEAPNCSAAASMAGWCSRIRSIVGLIDFPAVLTWGRSVGASSNI